MKLRITNDSIRLRLKQAEVRALVAGREVSESCANLFHYSLRPAESAELVPHGGQTGLIVDVPKDWLAGWDLDARVGFETNRDGLQILIEKDWKCVNPSNPKDNEDCYENPTPAC